MGEGPVPDIADHPEYYAAIADWLLKHPEVEAQYGLHRAHARAGNRPRVAGPALRQQGMSQRPSRETHRRLLSGRSRHARVGLSIRRSAGGRSTAPRTTSRRCASTACSTRPRWISRRWPPSSGTLQTPRSGAPRPTPASNSSTNICGTPTRACSSTGTSRPASSPPITT